MFSNKPKLGLTLGDPNGIGPEIIIRALHQLHPFLTWQPIVFGDLEVLQAVNHQLDTPLQFVSEETMLPHQSTSTETMLPYQLTPSPSNSANRVFDEDSYVIPVHDIAVKKDRQWQPGLLCAWGGETAYRCLVAAIEAAKTGKISAIATAPLSKAALHAAGHFFPGHTEILSHHTNQAQPVMMLTVDNLRAIHVTVHLALRQAIASLTPERILKVMRIAHQALIQMGIEKPRLGVPGLNPHASENGIFGTEERDIILPAIEQARREGMDCEGPISPDVIFIQHRDNRFDAVIALYHDQAHIPLKLIGFERGVNVTLGLPIIRTSVDHGTAFDRAALFQADPNSLIHAIHMAHQLVSSSATSAP